MTVVAAVEPVTDATAVTDLPPLLTDNDTSEDEDVVNTCKEESGEIPSEDRDDDSDSSLDISGYEPRDDVWLQQRKKVYRSQQEQNEYLKADAEKERIKADIKKALERVEKKIKENDK